MAARGGRHVRRQAAAPRAALARPSARGPGRGGHDDRGARSVEREGEARARLAAGHPTWRKGFAEAVALGRTSCSTSCGPRPSGSPTACSAASPRRRTSCRRRCCASTRALEAARIESPRATSPRSRRASPSTSCAPRGRAARRYPGEWLPEPLVGEATERPSRGRDGRLAVARLPRASREPLSRAARGAPAARRLRLRLRRDREDRRQVGGQRDSWRRVRGDTSRNGGRDSSRRARSARSSHAASSPLRATATSAPSSRCWPTTSCCTATAAARCPRWRGRCKGAAVWPARSGNGSDRARGWPRSR